MNKETLKVLSRAGGIVINIIGMLLIIAGAHLLWGPTASGTAMLIIGFWWRWRGI